MKKIYLIVLACLVVGGGGGYLTWRVFGGQSNPSSSPTPSSAASGGTGPATTISEFMWGVNLNPSSARKYNIETWNAELAYVTALGAKWIRLPFDNEPANKFTIFDEMIGAANTAGINVYLGIGSSEPILSINDTYKDGEKVATEIASHYKGKIKYYQLMSEQGSTALKGSSYSGEKESDYDKAKYEKVREWMKGASAAIRKIDPEAKLVITDQWTHTAYFDMLTRDKVDFDVIGWNWFGDMGMMGERKLKDGTKLIDKLKSFNKPVILAEINYRPDKNGMNEKKQADYIKKMAEWAYNSGVIRGFLVHEMFDLAPLGDRKADYYGLVKFEKAPDGGYTFGDPREAFTVYKEIIAKYSK